jgi:cytoskeleton protein RodZ
MGRRKRRRRRGGQGSGLPGDAPETFELEITGDPEPAHALAEVAVGPDASASRHEAEAEPGTGSDAAATLPGPEGESAAEPIRSDLNVQTLGELLQEAREARRLSVEEASARTRISILMLRHLENDRFGELPADAYVKGFLRSYGGFLGLDVGMLIRRYETLAGRAVDAAPVIWTEEVEPKTERSGPSRRVLLAAAGVVFVPLLAWAFWSQGAARFGLRPKTGLEQIENDLLRPDHDTQAASAAPGVVAPLRSEDTSPTVPDSAHAVRPDTLRSAADSARMDALPPPAPPHNPARAPDGKARKTQRHRPQSTDDLEPVPLDDFRPQRP